MIETVESIQLALFLREPPLSALSLWPKAFGSEPTGFNTMGEGHTQAQGVIDGSDMILVSQAAGARIDLHVNGPGTDSAPPMVHEPDSALATARKALTPVIQAVQTGRVACVMQGYSRTASMGLAVERVREIVPDLFVPEGAVDIGYNVSVSRDAHYIPGRQITRLCRWQAANFQYIQIVPGSPPRTSHVSAAHAHVDVFGAGMANLTAEQALEELGEVTQIAKSVLFGGPNELA